MLLKSKQTRRMMSWTFNLKINGVFGLLKKHKGKIFLNFIVCELDVWHYNKDIFETPSLLSSKNNLQTI